MRALAYASTADRSRHEANNTRMAWLIGNLLRLGVIVSLSLVVLGMVVTFVQHPDYVHSPDSLRPLTNSGKSMLPHTTTELQTWVFRSTGLAIIAAGLLVLIATPVLRVILSMLLFVRQRDWPYVVLTLTVLVLLTASFLIGMMRS